MGNDFKRGIKIYLETSDYGKGIDEMVASTQKYETQLGELSKKSEELQRSGKAVGKEWDDLQKQMRRTEQQVTKSKAAEESYRVKLEQMRGVLNNLSGASYNHLIAAQRQLQKEVQSAARGSDLYKTKLEQLNRVTQQVTVSKRELSGQVSAGKFSIGKLADGVSRFSGLALGAIGAITGITMGLKKFVDMNKAMESSQANLKALTGLDDESITWLSDQARMLATETRESGIVITQSSQEIVDAYTLVGSAKPELLSNKQALKEVTEQTLILASASKMKLNDAVNGVTTAMNMYGASANEANRYVNVLAAGSKFGAANVQQQTDAILKAGVAASSTDVSFEQLTGTIQMLAEKGIKSEIAGTGLKKFFLTLATGASDTNPKVVGLSKALETLAEKQLSAAQMKKMFGEEGYNVAQVLIGNTEKVMAYTEAVTNTATATEQASINSATAEAKMAQAGNKMKELGMQLVDGLNPAILKLANGTNLFLKLLVRLPGFLKQNAATIGILTIAWIAYAVAVNASTIATKLSDFWTKKFIVSIKTLTAVVRTNPFGMLLTAVSLLLPFISSLIKKLDKTADSTEKLKKLNENSDKILGETDSIYARVAALDSLNEAQVKILKNDIAKQINEHAKSNKEYGRLINERLNMDYDYIYQKRHLDVFMAEGGTQKWAKEIDEIRSAINIIRNRIQKDYNKEIIQNNEALKKLRELYKQVTDFKPLPKITPQITESDTSEDKKEKEYKKALETEKRRALEKEILIKENAIKEKKTLESIQDDVDAVKKESLINQIEINRKYGKDASDLILKNADDELKNIKSIEDEKLKTLTNCNKAMLDANNVFLQTQKLALLKDYNNREISEEQYNASLLTLEEVHAKKRVEIAKEMLFQLQIIEGVNEEKRLELVKKVNEEIINAELSLGDKLKAIRDKNIQDFQNKQDRRKEILNKYNISELQSISLNYKDQKQELDKSLEDGIISEEEHAKAVTKVKLEAAAGYASAAVNMTNMVSDMVKSIHQAEADDLEAQKQKELAAAGDNAEERERIENEYAQKALDLKKKQADADAGIQIAQAIAGAALAGIQAFAQLGPIAGGIAAGIIAVTLGFQIKSIIAQRDAIKRSTLGSPATSVSTPPQGERVVAQAADGRYDVIGEEDGVLYHDVPYVGSARTGVVKRPTLVAEQGDELIVDNATLQRLRINAPEVLRIIQNNRVPQRKDGKFNNIGDDNALNTKQTFVDNKLMSELSRLRTAITLLSSILKWLQRNRVEAHVSLSDFEKKRNQFYDNRRRGGI